MEVYIKHDDGNKIYFVRAESYEVFQRSANPDYSADIVIEKLTGLCLKNRYGAGHRSPVHRD